MNLKKFKKIPAWIIWGIGFVLIYFVLGWGLFLLFTGACKMKLCYLAASGPVTIITFPLFVLSQITSINIFSEEIYNPINILWSIGLYFLIGALIGTLSSIFKSMIKSIGKSVR